MSAHDIDKFYVSPYDKFMYEFDATHEKSASQLKEIEKHQRIAERRDNATPEKEREQIWKGF